MKKFLFSVCAVLAIFGCGGENVDELPLFISCPNPSVYGNSMSCGGQTYRTVNINGRIWMAENLNYDPGAGTSACYDNNSSNCAQYGRLYDWATAKGVCPSGWHLPSQAEWNGLGDDATKLKSTTGWYGCGPSGSGNSYLCEDTYGFSALPGGYGSSGGNFLSAGSYGIWWSSTEIEDTGNDAYLRGMDYDRETAGWYDYGKGNVFSVRCLQD